MKLIPVPLYLAFPAILVSLAFSVGDFNCNSWSIIVSQSFLFACLTLLLASLVLRFFLKYDKSTVLSKEDSEIEVDESFLKNLLTTVAFLLFPLASFFTTNSLLGPLRASSLFVCLLVANENSDSKKEGFIYAKYQGMVLLIIGCAFDSFILQVENIQRTILGYSLFFITYAILFNPFNSLKIENYINRLPDFKIILGLTIGSLLLFAKYCSHDYNIKMLLISVLSLIVTLASSIDIEKLHRSKTKALTSFIDTEMLQNYRLKYLVFNVILIFVYFLHIGLISEVDSLSSVIYDFLQSHWIIIISNISFIFLIVQNTSSEILPGDTNDENITDYSMSFFSLIVHLFYAEESKSIFNFFLLNLAFMFIQLLYSFRSKSLSLLSDSLHMLLDCISLFFGLMASVIAKQNRERPTTKFPFGLSRIETLAGFTNGSLLLGIVFGIFNESVQRIFTPVALENTTELLIVSFMGLLVNLVGIFAFNHGDSHGHGHDHGHSHSHLNFFGNAKNEEHSHEHSHVHDHKEGDDHDSQLCEKNDHDDHDHQHSHTENQSHSHSHLDDHSQHEKDHSDDHEHDDVELNDNMHGIFLHILADTLGSVGVIISTIIVKFTGWKLVDPITSMLIASLILASAIPLLKSSSSNLLLSVPDKSEKELHYILAEVLKIPGVKSYTTPRFWPLEGSSFKLIGYLHIQFFKSENSMGIRQKVDRLFENSKCIEKVYLQIENEMDDCWCRKEGIFGTI